MITQSGHVIVHGHKVPVIIKKRSGQKHIRLIPHRDGSLVVSMPRSCGHAAAEGVITQNIEWIHKHVVMHKKNVTIDPCVIKTMKKSVRPIIEVMVLQFNSYYNFAFTKIHIRHQRTRWGSCSSDGVLSFNCAIMCLPRELREYIVVHELCHLAEMNHSKRFWSLVEQTIPQYKNMRKELKKYDL